jgi:hypothetical protein
VPVAPKATNSTICKPLHRAGFRLPGVSLFGGMSR